MTTPPPLPTPKITDPPNIPSDLANVAMAIENQAVAAYAGYNTTSAPSATSLESRVTAIDTTPSGTVSGIEGRLTALNTAISAWTLGSSTNLTAQSARTAAFGPRQDSQDATMTAISSSLSVSEPQINALKTTRPLGILYTNSINYNSSLSGIQTLAWMTFNAVYGRWYRVSFSGSFQTNVGLAAQRLVAYWVYNSGTTPQTDGNLAGGIYSSLPTANTIPFAVSGLIRAASGTITVALTSYLQPSQPGANTGGTVVGRGSTILEDIGAF